MRNIVKASSDELHQAVLKEIEALLTQLGSDATDPRLAQTMALVRDHIKPVQANLVQRIEELERAARWDTFTIAFYGETNAGKSTIIETLRILLNERTKTDARTQFRQKQSELGLTETAFSALQKSLDESGAKLTAERARTAERHAELAATEAALAEQLSRLRDQIAFKKRAAPLWRKILYLLSKWPEEAELAREEQRREALQAANAAEKKELDAQCAEAERVHQALDERLKKTQAALDGLTPWADGTIIGTGRSDFTIDTRGYQFEVNGQRFELLDVPGIEGKEARVMQSILSAVHGAHAVFYVTGKPGAPQTGGEEGAGTLEKIRAHLGDQAEVSAIYNKRITNPMQLETGKLINASERSSLGVLDETMHDHLGERYQGCRALSALPAFLAVADCLVPFSDAARSRAKFLAKFTEKKLLSKSGFQDFIDWLTSDMVADCDARIRIANVGKVRSAVQEATGTITLAQRDRFAPLAAQLKRDWAHVDKQLELAVTGLIPALHNRASSAIHVFETAVRRQVYARIDGGIGNDDLKSALGAVIRREQGTLESELPVAMKVQLEQFQQDVADLLERFQARVEELQEAFRGIDSHSLQGGLELNISFDSGVKYMPLVAALAGGLMMLWNPAGWVSLAIGGVTLVVSVAKALWGLIDSDYKKSQQRKAANENIERVVGRMRDAMKQSCDEVAENVAERIGEIRENVQGSVEQAAQVNATLIKVCANLAKLSKKMSEREAV